jgi:hypothetical protein
MSENQQKKILATWKEIADYLNCSVRTCIRWEADAGLPVHRVEDAPKTRVFAYPHELDAWLQTANHKKVAAISASPKPARPILRNVVIALILLTLCAVIYFVVPKRKIPAKNASANGVPQSTGVLEFVSRDIVTSEYAASGRLSVWRPVRANEFRSIWSIDPVRHSSLAVGDLDGEPDLEIVSPGHCREFVTAGDYETSKIRFFLNAYKFGIRDWWKTTFYDLTQCVYEKENYEFTEISIADIAGSRENEIILLTLHGISSYTYDPAKGAIMLRDVGYEFPTLPPCFFRGLAVGDYNQDGRNDVLVLANGGTESAPDDRESRLLVLGAYQGRCMIYKSVPFDGATSAHSLRIGDVIPGGPKEVVFPLYRKTGDKWEASLIGWNTERGIVFDRPVSAGVGEAFRPVQIDVGDLDWREGAEILVGRSDPNELAVYSWDGSGLQEGKKVTLDPRARMTGVRIDDSGKYGKNVRRVVVSGGAEVEAQAGKSYLEVFSFGDGVFKGLWKRIGGEKGDLPVTSVGFWKQ